MEAIGKLLNGLDVLQPLSESEKTCAKHGIAYTEKVFKHFVQGCPECRLEAEAQQRAQEEQARAEAAQNRLREQTEQRIGQAGIPKRFAAKTVSSYRAETEAQHYVRERIRAYCREFEQGHSGRNLALLGNAGTGKTHLACAVGCHVIKNCNGFVRFVSVSELNRLVRESKSYSSAVSESEVIRAFGSYDLLIIDEVGVQSGTEAESRALFDVFNERYQNLKPTIMISNLDAAGFRDAVGFRITDRVKEDGGEVLFFDWESARGQVY